MRNFLWRELVEGDCATYLSVRSALLSCEIVEETIENRKNQAEEQGPPESSNLKTVDEVFDEKDQCGIDDKQEQTQRKNGDGNRQDHKDGFDDYVYNGQYQGNDQGGPIVVNLYAREKVSGKCNG